jgi:hypothetical protein
MKTFAIRLGFACNSSSTHSILLLNDASGLETVPSYGFGDYGWDCFQLVTRQDKSDYLAAQMLSTLQTFKQAGQFPMMVQELLPEATSIPMKEDGSYEYGYGVDHQSVRSFPVSWDETMLHLDWFRSFRDFVLGPNVVITGGNDNGDEKESIPAENRPKRNIAPYSPLDDRNSHGVARYDAPSDSWVLFNRSTGFRVRMTFNDTLPEIVYSETPELVDVKITDKCDTGCTYCYMGSTPSGAHASNAALDKLAKELAEMRVLEVAIGGGEATLHPYLSVFAQSLRSNHVVPNITTRNVDFVLGLVKDRGPWGAVAFSVDTAEQVTALAELVEATRKSSGKDRYAPSISISIQYVVGLTTNEAILRGIFKACRDARFRITLLGYKTTGRGLLFKQKAALDWFRVAKEENMTHLLGIDTTLARVHVEGLVQEGVDPRTITQHEGQFSCYVDAVAGRMRMSSYDNQEGIDITKRSLHDAWDMLHGKDPSAGDAS